MVKVQMNSVEVGSPAGAIAAQEQFDVTDAKGRVLTLKRPGVLAQFRLVEALGESAKNETYLGMVTPLLFLSAIDGDKVPPPAKKAEIEALIQRLDEDGVSAVMSGVLVNFVQEGAGEQVKN